LPSFSALKCRPFFAALRAGHYVPGTDLITLSRLTLAKKRKIHKFSLRLLRLIAAKLNSEDYLAPPNIAAIVTPIIIPTSFKPSTIVQAEPFEIFATVRMPITARMTPQI
jgi:hypothetical protein